ncbi:MAG: hypothetical protein KAR00_02745, partial [Candidatus Pacebacteria bacterium]|nr:hypothetical protein [Candidatus Paceibacterota bacterium]
MKSLSKKIVFLSPILALVISYILLNPVKFGICVETYTFGDYVGCFDKFSELLGTILLVVSFLTLPFSLATFWMKEEVFQS